MILIDENDRRILIVVLSIVFGTLITGRLINRMSWVIGARLYVKRLLIASETSSRGCPKRDRKMKDVMVFRTRKAITKISNLNFADLLFLYTFNKNKVSLHAKFHA